jgi:hypothetical protein
MCSSQACFDDLVTRSPDGMHKDHCSLFGHEFPGSQPFAGDFHRLKSQRHKESIDEVLEKYRPTQHSILDCIACLDESSINSTHMGRDSMMLRVSAKRFGDPRSSELKAAPMRRCDSDCILTHKPSDAHSDPDEIDLSNRCSRKRRSMSMKEKEDRRREQNREAQRRYREKHMFPNAKTSLEDL